MRSFDKIIQTGRIPNGKYRTSEYLVPIAKDHPYLGQGGGFQAITNKSIIVDQITDLRNGEIIFKDNN